MDNKKKIIVTKSINKKQETRNRYHTLKAFFL